MDDTYALSAAKPGAGFSNLDGSGCSFAGRSMDGGMSQAFHDRRLLHIAVTSEAWL